jgi:hypothetical protein
MSTVHELIKRQSLAHVHGLGKAKAGSPSMTEQPKSENAVHQPQISSTG